MIGVMQYKKRYEKQVTGAKGILIHAYHLLLLFTNLSREKEGISNAA